MMPLARDPRKGRGLERLDPPARPGHLLLAGPDPQQNVFEEERVTRVLIVDDNQDSADALATVLRLMGHHSEVAYNGSAALDKINRFSPELFLLDLALPDMDGYELVRRLRPLAGKEARFVALTGYGPGIGGNLAANLFDEHVVKPISPEGLLRVLALVQGPDLAMIKNLEAPRPE